MHFLLTYLPYTFRLNNIGLDKVAVCFCCVATAWHGNYAAMSLKAMPLIYTNLGCEMLYILEQRLIAQSIPLDKSTRVLHDVAKTMFNEAYVEKLFAPQELYTVSTVRKIFEQIAHSSIMKLSEPR